MNTKMLILSILFSTLFISFVPLELGALNYSLEYADLQTKRKSNNKQKEIDLAKIYSRTPIQFPEISLYQDKDGLTAFLFDNNEEINVQIIGEDSMMYYDGYIGGMQSGWELSADFLPEGMEYTIEFILPQGGYITGEFKI